ncbi:uncharacterized protein LOC131889235 [Tigriopus californicus]|uniref:uncharacterized protein LOC131889235 n=1 Tax=Tigriopus californicus TaxID=6832 RepID=UPI0027DA99AE|nr:uncharacterized protein LOC131889235 [Tigriopus californicus]
MGQPSSSSGTREVSGVSSLPDRSNKNPPKTCLGGKKCHHCGNFPHPRERCPARKVTCLKCSKMGHFARHCRSGRKTSVHTKSRDSPSSNLGLNNIVIAGITSPSLSPTILVNLVLKDLSYVFPIKAVPDTGAGITVMGYKLFIESGIDRSLILDPQTSHKIISINGTILKQIGQFHATISFEEVIAKNVQVVVCKEVNEFYLSLETCKSLNIVSLNFPYPGTHSEVSSVNPSPDPDHSIPHVQSPEVWPDRHIWINSLPSSSKPSIDQSMFSEVEQKIRSVYSVVFDDAEELSPMCGPIVGEPMRITLKDRYKPFAIHAARQVPYAYQDKVK